jgi:hypothetical protein
MGYDDDECLSCYCGDNGSGNNPTDESARTCLGCFNRITENYQNYPRVMSALRTWNTSYSNCERCGRQNCHVYNVPTCEYHPSVSSQRDESEDSDSSEE